jgi:hypothetical protein
MVTTPSQQAVTSHQDLHLPLATTAGPKERNDYSAAEAEQVTKHTLIEQLPIHRHHQHESPPEELDWGALGWPTGAARKRRRKKADQVPSWR